MGFMSAILHTENCARFHEQVFDSSKRIPEEEKEEIALPMGRTLFDVAATMCALPHYPLMAPVPPARPGRRSTPPDYRTSQPDDPAAISASLGVPDRWAARPAATSKRTSSAPEVAGTRIIRDIIQEFANPADPRSRTALDASRVAECNSTKIATTTAGTPRAAPQVPQDASRAAGLVESAKTGTQDDEVLCGPTLPT